MVDAPPTAVRAAAAILIRCIAICFFALLVGAACGCAIAVPMGILASLGALSASSAFEAVLTIAFAVCLGAMIGSWTLPVALPLVLATDLRKSIPAIAAGAVIGTMVGIGFGDAWGIYGGGYGGGFVGWLVGALRWRSAYFVDPRGDEDLAWLWRRRRKRPPRRAPPLLHPSSPT